MWVNLWPNFLLKPGALHLTFHAINQCPTRLRNHDFIRLFFNHVDTYSKWKLIFHISFKKFEKTTKFKLGRENGPKCVISLKKFQLLSDLSPIMEYPCQYLIDSLTDSCLVDLTYVTLAFEDTTSKVLDADSFADVDDDQSAWYQGATTNYLEVVKHGKRENLCIKRSFQNIKFLSKRS